MSPVKPGDRGPWVISIRDTDQRGHLSFDLRDILEVLRPRLPNHTWIITQLDCVGDGVEKYMQRVEQSIRGYVMSSESLVTLVRHIHQTIDATLVGLPRTAKAKLNPRAVEIQNFPDTEADLIIMGVDSTFFEVMTKNFEDVLLLQKRFTKVSQEDPANYFPNSLRDP